MHASHTRRATLLGLGATLFGHTALALAHMPGERRLVVVMLRGALDGLAAVVPYGDGALAALRGPLLPPEPGRDGGVLDLGGFYGLHPALTGLHAMFAAGELLPIHAVAGPKGTRSHFEAQDLMESGADRRLSSGWLNRAVSAMPAPQPDRALSVGVSLPLLLRGAAPVGAYAPQGFSQPQPDLYARLMALHRADPVTGPALRQGLLQRGFSNAQLADVPAAPDRFGFPALAGAAGRLLAAADGPRVAAMELDGWDTHAGQAARLQGPLRQLDAGMAALRDGLGVAWAHAAVLVMTEFGRTVRTNGTGGTDHGTGGVAFLLGGAVRGGRVLADWPGLGSLLDDRDLRPTLDLRAVAKGVLAAHGLDAAALATVFPDSADAPPCTGLLRA